MDWHNWLLFLPIAFIATLTPGPAILLATTHSIEFGFKAAIYTILGNITGLLILCSLSVVGLSAIIVSSVAVFTVIKYIGAFYLIYLGVSMWRNGFSSKTGHLAGDRRFRNRRRLYVKGMTVALSNPKAIAFTTALFPQFIEEGENVFVQFMLLVLTFLLLSFCCISFYAYMAEHAGQRLQMFRERYVSKFFGGLLVGAGLMLAKVSQKN